MTTAASTTASDAPVSLEAMNRMMRELELLPPPEWILIAPDGRVFKGDQQTVARVIFQNIDIPSLFKENP